MRRVAALMLLASLCAPPGAGAAACPNATTSGRWTTITLPEGAATFPVLVVPAARSGARDVLLASTSRRLYRSADGGCTWQKTYDLDVDAPSTSRARTSPMLRVANLAVSGARNGTRTTYALFTDDGGQLTTSFPIVTLVSTDGGAHWGLHEVPTDATATAYPRCGSTSAIAASPDPAVAHLSCDAFSVSEVFTTTTLGPQCATAMYVTTDAGTTWRQTTSPFVDYTRWKLTPPTDLNGGCEAMGRDHTRPVVADPVATRTVWRTTICGDAVFRSTASGADAKTFGTLSPPEPSCTPQLLVGTLPRSGVAVLVCDGPSIFTATKPGPLAKRPPAVPSSESGVVRGCAWDARTGRAVVFYTDGAKRPRVLTYDVTRNAWQSVAFLPALKSGHAWEEFDLVDGDVSAMTRTLYVRSGTRGPLLFRTSL